MVITGGWCVAQEKRNIHTEDTTSHGEKIKEKKKEKKTGKKKEVPSIELANFDWIPRSLMVSPPTLQRHQFAKSQSFHATFLYPTARLPPPFRCNGGVSMQWW